MFVIDVLLRLVYFNYLMYITYIYINAFTKDMCSVVHYQNIEHHIRLLLSLYDTMNCIVSGSITAN